MSVCISECLGVKDCENGGTCKDGISEYTCRCVAGYTGQLCEVGRYLSVYVSRVRTAVHVRRVSMSILVRV